MCRDMMSRDRLLLSPAESELRSYRTIRFEHCSVESLKRAMP